MEVFLLGFFSLCILTLARSYDFFKLPQNLEKNNLPSLFSLLMASFLFIGIPILFGNLILQIFQTFSFSRAYLVVFQTIVINVFVLLGFILIGWKNDKLFFQNLFKNRKGALFTIIAGVGTWFIAFPTVHFVESLSNMIMSHLLHVQNLPDQAALQLLKVVSTQTVPLLLLLFIIIILAPLLEELFFRAFLQQWLKRHFSINQAILITGVIFALFHFSLSQGWHNVSIISAIFVLSYFLSLIYEKEESLLAPIALHSTFNAINALIFVFFKAS